MKRIKWLIGWPLALLALGFLLISMFFELCAEALQDGQTGFTRRFFGEWWL